MSISRNGRSGVEDLEEQVVEVAYSVLGEDRAGDGSFVVDQIASFDPAGGINRDEVAELVAYQPRTALCRVRADGSEGQTPGNVDGQMEWSFNPDIQFMDGQTSDSKTVDDPNGTEAPVNILKTDYSGNDVFWTPQSFNTSAFNDTVNGTGGGAGVENTQTSVGVVNLREEFGAGYIADVHDKVYCHGTIQAINNPNVDIHGITAAKLYWDIQEREKF